MKPKETESIVTKRKTKEEWKREHKGKRLDGLNLRLVATERPGWKGRFVKDTPQRIAQMKGLGYQFAKDFDGQTCEKVQGGMLGAPMGVTREKDNTIGLLMETPIENWEALQELKSEGIQALENQMRAGHHEENSDDKRYVPAGGIQIGRK